MYTRSAVTARAGESPPASGSIRWVRQLGHGSVNRVNQQGSQLGRSGRSVAGEHRGSRHRYPFRAGGGTSQLASPCLRLAPSRPMCSRTLSLCSGGAAGAEVSTPEIARVRSHRTDCRACRAASHQVANLAIGRHLVTPACHLPMRCRAPSDPRQVRIPRARGGGTRRRRGTRGRFRAASVLNMLLVTACTPKHLERRRAEMAGAGRRCQLSDTWRRGVSAFRADDSPPTRAVTARTSRPPSSRWLALQRAHCFPSCLSIPPRQHSLLLDTVPRRNHPTASQGPPIMLPVAERSTRRAADGAR
jgi:hypothetical protein